jgi:integrase
MASAVRNSRGYWLARWKDATGRWRKRRATPNMKRTAQALAEELELRARRQLDGLEPLPPRDGGGTVGDLLHWWLQRYSPRLASHDSNEATIRTHLLGSDLARLTLQATRPADVKALLDAKAETGLAPRSVNHLRSFLSRAFNQAISTGRWPGANPVTSVPSVSVGRSQAGDFLRAEEVPRVLGALHPRWRPLFAAAVYSGMRKGELLALRREDVDLRSGSILVRRSWERETTKGGHIDAIPIPAALVPWLEDALSASASSLVFPGPSGDMFRRDVPLEDVLRRALGRASIVRHWRHVCRRRGCGHAEEHQDGELRRCPRCRMKLWPKPVVRPIRFHDLRHTTATLLLRSGVPLVVVQKMLRHRDPKLTEATYGHLATDYLRAEVNRLKLEGMPVPEKVQMRAAASARVPPVSPTPPETLKGPEQRGENPSDSDPFSLSGRQDSNLRPLGPEPSALPG